MKKIFAVITILSLVFVSVCFAADTQEFAHKTSAKELAELARVIMQKAKNSGGNSENNGKGVDFQQIISAVNTLARNKGDINSVFGDSQQSSAAHPSAAVSAVNGLTMKLYGEAAGSGENVFLSPYSISTALAMVYAGARGETAKEMEQALGFSPAVHASMGSLISQLNSVSPDIAQLHTANAIWPAADKNILSDYRNRAATNYFSEITTLDYSNTEAARTTINKWVEEKTSGKIKNMVSKGAISKNTPLTLTNAVYFKSDWQSKFETAATKKADFFTADNKKIKTNFMRQTGYFDYFKDSGAEILELPYKAERLSMYVILPQKDSFADFEKSLDADKIDSMIAQAARTNVAVSLPKFKMEENYNLNDALKKFGMADAFTSKANFSGMNGLLDISLGVVLHKTYIDVYEAGTEAAAATYVGMKSMAMPQKPAEFKADRPFVFLIRDNVTGVNLFIGRFMKP